MVTPSHRPISRPFRTLVCLLGSFWLQPAPLEAAIDAVPAPADGIYDDTRALTEATRRELAEELKDLATILKCDMWLTATSFSAAGFTPRRQAQVTRLRWSGDRPAILLGYDRATNSLALSLSPDLWDRYPAPALATLALDSNRIVTDPKLSLDERFSLLVQQFAERMRELEKVRLQQMRWFPEHERRFSLILVAALLAGASIAIILGILSRRYEGSGGQQFTLPDVAVSSRLGAPYGGGLIAEIHLAPAGK